MAAQSDTHDTQAGATADLARLGAELAARGYEAAIRTPPARLAYLTVTNPRATMLSERVYIQNGSFYWSWAEPITACTDVTSAAATVAHVLHATGGGT
ncbi:MAG TPA: hypothetical protein VGM53_08900 [Streptosporangiaceae bacterium]|jgi:hypothetical protein